MMPVAASEGDEVMLLQLLPSLSAHVPPMEPHL